MPQSLRVGLLGCGRLGTEVMLPLLAGRPDVRVSVVADPDPSARTRAHRLAPGAEVDEDWRDALGRPDLDAVIVAMPTALHGAAGLAAITRGIATYLEKPMAPTLAQASAMRDAWRVARPTLAVGFNARFHPLVVRMRRHVADGRIGDPRLVRCAFSVAAVPGNSWRHPDADGGGVLHDLASHHVDLVRCLLDSDIAAVGAMRTVTGAGGETIVANGVTRSHCAVSATWTSATVDEDVVEVVGSEGAVRMSRYEDLTLVVRGRAVPGAAVRLGRVVPTPGALGLGLARRRAPWNDPSFAAALDNFFRAAREHDAVVPGIDEGWHSARVVAAIAEAAGTGRVVEIAREDSSHVA